jgi:3-hydroxy acid dehydrogenase/malonic semialdehyde reductase
MLCTRKSGSPHLVFDLRADSDFINSGCEPLTPEDIAEVVVFAAGRRENVVVADSLIFPNHQAGATTMHKRT